MSASGFVLVDKSSGMNSRAVGSRIAKMFGIRKFGHVGTLDPMASGLLIIAIGDATKVIPYLPDTPKEYEFSIKWGIRTDTDDITGQVIDTDENIPNDEMIRMAVSKLHGEVWQTPPAYSAVHIDGRRAYDLARRGQQVDLPRRKVMIYKLTFKGNNTFHVECSAGTYVRSIVQDIANIISGALSVPILATCDMIRRTATNGQNIKNATTLDFLENLYNNGGRIDNYLMPVDFGLGDIPVHNLIKNDARLFLNGGFLTRESFKKPGSARIYHDDKFIGIGEITDGVLKPKRIINVAENLD